MRGKRKRPACTPGTQYVNKYAMLCAGRNRTTTAPGPQHALHFVRQVLRLPAYARHLMGVLADTAAVAASYGCSPDGKRPTIWVLIGSDAWCKAREWQAMPRLFVLLPPGEDARQFDWSSLRGYDPVMVLACGAVRGSTVQGLVAAMMRAGVTRVLFVGSNGAARYVRAKDETHG